MSTECCSVCGKVFNPYGGHVCNSDGYRPQLGRLHALAPAKNPDVVERLEDLLARARSGELQAVAVAGITSDGGASTVWAGDRWAALLGCTFDLLCRLREEGKPPER